MSKCATWQQRPVSCSSTRNPRLATGWRTYKDRCTTWPCRSPIGQITTYNPWFHSLERRATGCENMAVACKDMQAVFWDTQRSPMLTEVNVSSIPHWSVIRSGYRNCMILEEDPWRCTFFESKTPLKAKFWWKKSENSSRIIGCTLEQRADLGIKLWHPSHCMGYLAFCPPNRGTQLGRVCRQKSAPRRPGSDITSLSKAKDISHLRT